MERSTPGAENVHAAAPPRRWRWASPRTAAILCAVALVLTLATIPTSILVARADILGSG